MPDIATTAAERTEAAQRLIDEAQAASYVELVTVSALELCVLGGPRHALAELAVTEAWLELKDRRREKIMKQVTDGMVERGLLLPEPSPEPGGADLRHEPGPGHRAGRAHPAGVHRRHRDGGHRPAHPALPRPRRRGGAGARRRGGGARRAARGLARDFPNVAKLGPLGRFYRYLLVSRARAAELLAEWAIAPPPPAAAGLGPRGVPVPGRRRSRRASSASGATAARRTWSGRPRTAPATPMTGPAWPPSCSTC